MLTIHCQENSLPFIDSENSLSYPVDPASTNYSVYILGITSRILGQIFNLKM